VITGCGLSILAMVFLFVGLIRDGVFSTIAHRLDTCYDQDMRVASGNTNYTLNALNCAPGRSEACLCVDGNDLNTCYLFDLQSAQDCDAILNALSPRLVISVVAMVFLFVLVFAYSIFTCKELCCNGESGEPGSPKDWFGNPIAKPLVKRVRDPGERSYVRYQENPIAGNAVVVPPLARKQSRHSRQTRHSIRHSRHSRHSKHSSLDHEEKSFNWQENPQTEEKDEFMP
jgi:hypothetical protein